MKRIISTAELGLRLTWVRVVVVFVLTGIGQWLLFSRVSIGALEARLSGYPELLGRLGNLALLLVIYGTLSGGRSKGMDLTLRRLSVSEWTVSILWTGLFAGYFLMYWACQIGLVLAMSAAFAEEHGAGPELLFVASFRSDYFHDLVPLREPWGFVRNGMLALGFGSFAALGSRNARRGRRSPLCLGFVMTIAWALLSQGQMANQTADVVFVLIALTCVGLDWLWSWRWTRYEAH